MERARSQTSLPCWIKAGSWRSARRKNWTAGTTTGCNNSERSAASRMKNHNVIVGIFVTAAIVLFGACLFLIGNQHKAFNRHVVFYTNFQSVDGLPKGSTVRVDGMDAGELVNIQIPTDPAQKFRLKL